jgi:hypothetical protein
MRWRGAAAEAEVVAEETPKERRWDDRRLVSIQRIVIRAQQVSARNKKR